MKRRTLAVWRFRSPVSRLADMVSSPVGVKRCGARGPASWAVLRCAFRLLYRREVYLIKGNCFFDFHDAGIDVDRDAQVANAARGTGEADCVFVRCVGLRVMRDRDQFASVMGVDQADVARVSGADAERASRTGFVDRFHGVFPLSECV
jgi:hypothetical protein